MDDMSDDSQAPPRPSESDTGKIDDVEQQLLRSMQQALSTWSLVFEVLRAAVADWTTRQQEQVKLALSRLNNAAQLDTPEKRASAVSDIVVDQMTAIVKNFAAANYRAATLAGAAGRKVAGDLQEGIAAGMSGGMVMPGMRMGSRAEAPKERGRRDARESPQC